MRMSIIIAPNGFKANWKFIRRRTLTMNTGSDPYLDDQGCLFGHLLSFFMLSRKAEIDKSVSYLLEMTKRKEEIIV